MLLALALAAFLRFYQLDSLPPGLYRDEAFNGLDALGVLNGEHSLFFKANNGREPAYIYLTALFVGWLGRTVTAVRLAAAVSGTLTTLLIFLLGREWFGRRTGLFAAWLWAVTLWSIHLSRIGLRPILLVPVLTLTFWLGTLAYRRQRWWLWLLAGAWYGFGFYTYLAIRFTPLLLGIILLYIIWQKGWRRLWPGVFWFGGGTAVTLLPLALFYSQNLDLLLGRTDQVSIFNETINHGDFWGTLLQHIGRTLSLFLWQGDMILRHNPSGRPLFDLLLVLPFLIGLVYCLRGWRQPAAAITLLWVALMLWVTILAEDAPHFLRAVGILPAAMFLPAIGLNWLWRWPKLPQIGRQLLVIILLAGSLFLTIRDYQAYGRDPAVAYLFEAASVSLAEQLKQESAATAVYMDYWFWDDPTQGGWPSIPYLQDLHNVEQYRPEFGVTPAEPGQPVSIYAWEFGDLSFVPQLIQPPALVTIHSGELARGDLEAEAYPLYLLYRARPLPANFPPPTNFANQIKLRDSQVTLLDEQTLQIDLYWEADTAVDPNLVAFVHILGTAGHIISQHDAPPAQGYWQSDWWQSDLIIQEQRQLILPEPYNPQTMQISVGLYNPHTSERLNIIDSNDNPTGDHLILPTPP